MRTAERTGRAATAPACTPPTASSSPAAPRTSTDIVQAGLLALASFTALLPLGRVIQRGDWALTAVALCVVLLAVGQLARAARLGGLGAVLAELIVATGMFTAIGFAGTGVLGIIPTGATLAAAADAVSGAATQISEGISPLPDTPALVLTLLLAYAVLVILLDWVVLWARLPLVGSFLILLVLLIPGAVIPADSDVWALVLALLGIGMLLYRSTAVTRREAQLTAPGVAPLAIAAAVTALAVGTAAFLAPVLPGGPGSIAAGLGPGPKVDASIDLGRDLRRPREAQLLTYRSTLSSPPYLRMATLTRFVGNVWQPDQGESEPLRWLIENPDPPADPQIAVVKQTATVRLSNIRTDRLPLPARATEVRGVSDAWQVLVAGRTVRTPNGNAGNQEYAVAFDDVRPTAEQIREQRASADGTDAAALAIPKDVPPEVAQLAREVTAGARTDYDRLLALQTWFRSSEFRYSLDAPVEDGYDGTSMRALGAFLQERSGYCVHFATAFTLMARSLGMPTRIVLGTLPGETTGESVDNQVVWRSTTSDLHTWPEVRFSGIGWVPFDPTASLGTPTSFASATATAPTTEPTASAPVPTATARDDVGDAPTTQATATAEGTGIPLQRIAPALAFAALAVAVLLVPLLVRAAMRRRRRTAAARGDAVAAWEEFCADLTDHGVDTPESDTPRTLVARVQGRVARTASEPLLAAIERRSYAEHDGGTDGDELVTALDRVRQELRRGLRMDARITIVCFPRSLAHPIRRRLPARRERPAG